jgi:hypothetical protein
MIQMAMDTDMETNQRKDTTRRKEMDTVMVMVMAMTLNQKKKKKKGTATLTPALRMKAQMLVTGMTTGTTTPTIMAMGTPKMTTKLKRLWLYQGKGYSLSDLRTQGLFSRGQSSSTISR